MDALILNSGLGSRMAGMLDGSPKCVLEVDGGKPLVAWQIEQVIAAGAESIFITTGYRHEEVMRAAGSAFPDPGVVTFIHNPDFASTNYIYSIYLGLHLLQDDLLLMHGDLYFSPGVLQALVQQNASSVVVDSTTPWSPKDFKARVQDGLVREIGVGISEQDGINCQPLYSLRKADWLTWAGSIRALCELGQTGVYAEEALNAETGRIQLHPFDIRGGVCMEVDTPEDYRMLKERIGNG